MYSDDELLPISALQHFVFCQRQCALIHIEQVWTENLLTAEGRILHEKTHEERVETRDGIRVERGIFLRSDKLGLIGKADVVEFHKPTQGDKWNAFPVEYKHGKPKDNNCDKIQLSAQALCLEEMLKADIPAGALFYGKTRHRLDVEFTRELREETMDTVVRLRKFINSGLTPAPVYDKKCESCSLLSICMPKIMQNATSVEQYIRQAVNEL